MKGKALMSVVHNVGFWTRRKSPELLLAGGIVAAGGAIFLAVKATLKLEGVVKQSNNNIKVVKDKMATGEYDSKVLKKTLQSLRKKRGKNRKIIFACGGGIRSFDIGLTWVTQDNEGQKRSISGGIHNTR